MNIREYAESVGRIEVYFPRTGYCRVVTPSGHTVEVIDSPTGPFVAPLGTWDMLFDLACRNEL